MEDGYKMTVTISLGEEKLKHADDSTCECEDEHEMEVLVNLLDHELHSELDCPIIVDGDVYRALQELHEAAHPKGSIFVEHCTASACMIAMGSLR